MRKRAYLGEGTVISVDEAGVAVLWDRRDGNTPLVYQEANLQLSKSK